MPRSFASWAIFALLPPSLRRMAKLIYLLLKSNLSKIERWDYTSACEIGYNWSDIGLW